MPAFCLIDKLKEKSTHTHAHRVVSESDVQRGCWFLMTLQVPLIHQNEENIYFKYKGRTKQTWLWYLSNKSI